MVSTDCGDNFTTVYKKGGSELATFPSPILNATSIPASFIDPGADNWRNEDVDLNAYKTFDKVIVKFSYKSSLGGSINIDNVRVEPAASGKDMMVNTSSLANGMYLFRITTADGTYTEKVTVSH
eukprot:gene34464-biopygen16085